MRTSTLAITFASLAGLAAGPLCFAAQPAAVMQRLNAIAPRMQELVNQKHIAGAVFLVAHHGEVVLLQAVGQQTVNPPASMRSDSIFQIMSMTKPVTAAGLMMLVEEGKVVLTDPVARYLPEFANQPRPADPPADPATGYRRQRPMTILHLLTHTNGMNDPPVERRKEIQSDLSLTLADAVKYYASQPLHFTPGSHWSYSNEGIATVGRIIEVVSGMPYQKYMEERILKPLGMKDSFYFPDEARIPRIAGLYRTEAGNFINPGDGTLGGDPTKFRKGAKYPAPEYGLYSTASDMAAFYQMMLDGGVYKGRRYLSRSTVTAMTTLHTGDMETASLGFGNGLAFVVPRNPDAMLDLLSMESFGHAGAFGTWSFADKAKDLVGVLMIQSAGPNNTEAQHVFTALAEAAIDR